MSTAAVPENVARLAALEAEQRKARETEPLASVRALPPDASLEAVEVALRLMASGVDGDPLRRATLREAAVALLGKIKIVSSPARLVDAALAPADLAEEVATAPGILRDIEPAQQAAVGHEVLDAIAAALERFVVLPAGGAEAIGLWVLHAHALGAAQVSPTLAIESATKRCGKTLLLELLGELAPRRLPAANISVAAVFRAIEAFSPTLLADEADTYIRDSDELRGVLNSSHRRSLAYVVRCDGEDMTPKTFSTWCAKAVALIGKLPPTLEDRSIVVKMRRKSPGERIERYQVELHAEVLHQLARLAARFAADHLDELRHADPAVPAGLHDRAADNWRPLLAIADAAGGGWPDRARHAAMMLSGDTSSMEMSELLLSDLRDLFRARGTTSIFSKDIITALVAIEEKPWAEYHHDKPITVGQLARLLAGFDVHPKTIRTGNDRAKGYSGSDLQEAWDRYLPALGVSEPCRRDNAATSSVSGEFAPVTPGNDVTDEKTPERNGDGHCHGVTAEKGGNQGGGGADGLEAPDDDWRDP